ncbi:hypothetical protein IHQ56_02630 [Methylobacillus flagellatus]|uniref:hypothetical protein n=1 Tax=Methylobacillus flagellatus TaxID=405 RepID=UPI002853940F|nr:hypothetical protein [Methylobacillus flagellatus]MDR5170705.1 hypothetical protein [Methylobacillus flagellatus]
MSATIISYVPDDAEVRDIAIQAKASHLYLIQHKDGGRAVLSPIVPAGFRVLMDPDSERIAKALEVAA